MPAALIGGVIAGAGAIGSAVIGSSAAGKAADAQTQAAELSVAEQRRQFDLARADQTPWRTVGGNSMYKLADIYGVPYSTTNADGTVTTGATGGASGGAGTGSYGGFMTSPGYQFRQDEGLKAIQRMGSAAGARFSPSTWKAAARYSSNLASDEFNNYTNALRAMAGLGQTSTAQTGALGVQTGQGIANAYTQAGNARASSYGAQGAIWGNALNNLGYLGQSYFGGGGGYAPMSGPPFSGGNGVANPGGAGQFIYNPGAGYA